MIKLLLKFVLTLVLLYLMSTFLDQYFSIQGGLIAFLIIGLLITLMNAVVRPLINLVLLPFKFFIGFIAVLVANAFFLWVTERIVEHMDPTVVILRVDQGLGGWLLIAVVLGLGNWVMKVALR